MYANYDNFFKSQSELNRLRREAKHNLVSQSHVEEERDVALTDFRRLMAEKESLKEKIKVSFFSCIACSKGVYGKDLEILLCLCLAVSQFHFSVTFQLVSFQNHLRELDEFSELSL